MLTKKDMCKVGVYVSITYLRNSEGGSPVFILVEDAQADCATGVDVRVEQHWVELALGGLVGVVLAELHSQLVDASFPG